MKAELDNQSDGITGNPLGAPGATAVLQVPTTWVPAPKGDVITAGSANQKTSIGVISSDSDSKRDSTATALGLTGCQWNPPESVTLGKDKLPASAADGLCSRGAAQIKTAYFLVASEKLLVVGGWDNAGGDMASVFGSMRATAKAATGDATGVAACCAALAQNAKSAPLQQQGAYMLAAGVCNAAIHDPEGRAALARVRAALIGANVPGACR